MKSGHIFQTIRIQNFNNWRLRKTNTLLNLINKQNDIDKIYLYEKDLSKSKYKVLIEKRENAGVKNLMIQTHLLSVQI